MIHHFRLLGLLSLLSGCLSAATSLRMAVDVSDGARGIFRNREEISVAPGPLTLVSAKWIPGDHSPTGPAMDLADLRFTANGQVLEWRRDTKDAYALHLNIPAGVETLVVENSYLVPASARDGAGTASSERLTIFNWTLTTLFPAGEDASTINAEASLTVPKGWKVATSLGIASASGAVTHFAPTTLEMLFDQPVLTGAYMKDFDLSIPGGPLHVLHIAADSPEALELSPERLSQLRRLPYETAAITGTFHFNAYHFLYALSDRFSPNGTEHHSCSDNRGTENTLLDDDAFLAMYDLLAHEYFHSWDGKFRRPFGLLSPDYQKPMEDDLLWVYEGLTEYYGRVLATRAGLATEEQSREWIADSYATLSASSGRTWRPLQDTADAAPTLYNSRSDQRSLRRGTDFYAEGALLWLEVDTLLRTESSGKLSLDDFVRSFFGDGKKGPAEPASAGTEAPKVVPYVREDIVRGLNALLPRDWEQFFELRINKTLTTPPPLALEKTGAKLVFTEAPNQFAHAVEATEDTFGQLAGIGLVIDAKSFKVVDVARQSAADRAGLAAGQTLVAVNGRKVTLPFLKAALKGTTATGQLSLIVENESFFLSPVLHYDGGLRFAHLERLADTPDVLHAILSPKVTVK